MCETGVDDLTPGAIVRPGRRLRNSFDCAYDLPMAHNPWPEIIKRYLKTHDVSQTQLAGRGGLSVQTVNRWINGKSVPDPKSMDKLAKGMRLESAELMWQYIFELDGHYRPLVPHLLDDSPEPVRPDLRERAEALLARDLNGIRVDMKLALGGLRDTIRSAVSSHESTSSLLGSLVSRCEDAFEAALKPSGTTFGH